MVLPLCLTQVMSSDSTCLVISGAYTADFQAPLAPLCSPGARRSVGARTDEYDILSKLGLRDERRGTLFLTCGALGCFHYC